ncbi:hypothetical protein ACF0H5_008912 [Mactra antiquata]
MHFCSTNTLAQDMRQIYLESQAELRPQVAMMAGVQQQKVLRMIDTSTFFLMQHQQGVEDTVTYISWDAR